MSAPTREPLESKLIGVGTDACIYRPPWATDPELRQFATPDYVMRVSSEPTDESLIERLQTIDPDQEHLVYAVQCTTFSSSSSSSSWQRRLAGCSVLRADAPVSVCYVPYGGKSLQEFLQSQSSLSFRQFTQIATSLVQSLALLHAHELGHGDLDEGNILLRGVDSHATRADARITDFETAVHLNTLTPVEAEHTIVLDQSMATQGLLDLATKVIPKTRDEQRAFATDVQQLAERLKHLQAEDDRLYQEMRRQRVQV